MNGIIESYILWNAPVYCFFLSPRIHTSRIHTAPRSKASCREITHRLQTVASEWHCSWCVPFHGFQFPERIIDIGPDVEAETIWKWHRLNFSNSFFSGSSVDGRVVGMACALIAFDHGHVIHGWIAVCGMHIICLCVVRAQKANRFRCKYFSASHMRRNQFLFKYFPVISLVATDDQSYRWARIHVRTIGQYTWIAQFCRLFKHS